MGLKNFLFKVKQYIKMTLQHVVFPFVYKIGCVKYRDVEKNLVLFADAHHTNLPFSMERMFRLAGEKGYDRVCHFFDYSNEGMWKSFVHSISFMMLFAKAKYVFICDCFLPVASCKKRKETRVVQLWHSGGLLKKMGYNTSEDIPADYVGNIYKNYDLVTVSAPCCVPFIKEGMGQEEGIVQALGVSRTDFYHDTEWIESCKDDFYQKCPEAKGKKILLWAPTFRGNASDPRLVGAEAVLQLKEHLKDEWFLLIKVHPHLDEKEKIRTGRMLSNCEIPTEKLLPVTDLFMTDYSSVLFDYLIFEKPFLLFAPDLAEYEEKRGFYIEYSSLTKHIITKEENLAKGVREAWKSWKNGSDIEMIRKCRDYNMAACDGDATERIMNYLESFDM